MGNFSNKTLNNISKLINNIDGLTGFRIFDAKYYTPRGKIQDCDAGVVSKEWVNQTAGGGFSGDYFYGTVTWKLGDYYLVATYNT